jgi:hypothetical protein
MNRNGRCDLPVSLSDEDYRREEKTYPGNNLAEVEYAVIA